MRGFNFTSEVRTVLAGARQEAHRLHHGYVAPEHILLAMLRANEGIPVTILRNLGASPEDLVSGVENRTDSGTSRSAGPDLPYTSRAKKVMELAMAECRQLDHEAVGTQHLLLGLIHEHGSMASQVLADGGVTLLAARDEARRLIDSGAADAPSSIPWTRLPARVRAVITQAHGIASSRGRPAVTAEDAAAALLAHGDGMANAVLDRLGFDRDRAIASFNEPSHGGAESTSDVATELAPDLVAALDAMRRAVRDTRDIQPGTQHLLLGILAASPRVVAVLGEQEITADDVQRVARQMSG